LLNDLFVLRR